MGIFLPAIEMAGYLCLMPTASRGGTIADNHKIFPLPLSPSLGGVSDEKQLMGAYQKSPRDERVQTGVLTPGIDAMKD